MNKDKIINRIDELFARFVAEIKIANANILYDHNTHSENVVIPILDFVYWLSLENSNSEKNNYPAVDPDDVKNRLTFQITATAND